MWVVNEKARLVSQANSELRLSYAELEQLQAETQRMAETDALTGLYNYGHFNDYLRREVATTRRFGRVLSLLMLDFVNFKKINENYGYRKGDEVLGKLSELLRSSCDDNGYIARYGNDEFVIVLKAADAGSAMTFARTLLRDFSAAASTGIPGEELRLNIGIADYPDCASDSQSLIAAADTALFLSRNKADSSIAYFCDLSDTTLAADDIQRLQYRLRGAGMATLKALARAVDASDCYVDAGGRSLSDLAVRLAGRLNMDEDEVELLVLATSIHDIGKIGIPVDVLTKTDRLSSAEVDMVKRHPEIGQDILREARQIQELVLAILYHHERWDGNGYPEGLEGNRIPQLARIVGIFDAYRAMRSDRPYRKALGMDQAIAELREGAGTQFDPGLVELFVANLAPGKDAVSRRAV